MNIIVINNYKDKSKANELQANLQRSTGELVELVDYKISNLKEHVESLNPDTVILSGSGYMLAKPENRIIFQSEIDMIGKLHVPILGICYGHQLIGAAFGSRVIDLGQTIRAMKDVNIVSPDPIFDNIPNPVRVSESHRQGLSKLPDGFHLLAESSTSKVEAMVHHTRPIYGVQFHPERWNEKYPYGRIILENFLKIALKRKQVTSGLATTISRLATSP